MALKDRVPKGWRRHAGLAALLLTVREDMGVTLLAVALVMAIRRFWPQAAVTAPAVATQARAGTGPERTASASGATDRARSAGPSTTRTTAPTTA